MCLRIHRKPSAEPQYFSEDNCNATDLIREHKLQQISYGDF